MPVVDESGAVSEDVNRCCTNSFEVMQLVDQGVFTVYPRIRASRASRTGQRPCSLGLPLLGLQLVLAGSFLGCERGSQNVQDRLRTPEDPVPLSWSISHVKPVAVEGNPGHASFHASLPDQVVTQSEMLEARVDCRIAPGFHLYVAEEEQSPFVGLRIECKVDDPQIHLGPVNLPPATGKADGHLIYRDTVTASVPITISEWSEREFTVTMHVGYQACNDLACFPLEELVIELPVRIERTPRLL